MARKPSPTRLAELQTYLSFVRAMWAFQEKLNPELRSPALPDGTPYVEAMAAWAQRAIAGAIRVSELLTGVKQAVADQLEMTRHLPVEAVRRADAALVAASAPSLTEMRRRVWRVIPKVLARGRIRNIDEFYVVKNVLDDDGEDLSSAERAKLARMRFKFETTSPRPDRKPRRRRMSRPKATSSRRRRTS
jgi:hypothetical protein